MAGPAVEIPLNVFMYWLQQFKASSRTVDLSEVCYLLCSKHLWRGWIITSPHQCIIQRCSRQSICMVASNYTYSYGFKQAFLSISPTWGCRYIYEKIKIHYITHFPLYKMKFLRWLQNKQFQVHCFYIYLWQNKNTLYHTLSSVQNEVLQMTAA
jgi:hypothetical protein